MRVIYYCWGYIVWAAVLFGFSIRELVKNIEFGRLESNDESVSTK